MNEDLTKVHKTKFRPEWTLQTRSCYVKVGGYVDSVWQLESRAGCPEGTKPSKPPPVDGLRYIQCIYMLHWGKCIQAEGETLNPVTTEKQLLTHFKILFSRSFFCLVFWSRILFFVSLFHKFLRVFQMNYKIVFVLLHFHFDESWAWEESWDRRRRAHSGAQGSPLTKHLNNRQRTPAREWKYTNKVMVEFRE